jgi:hypothetical protein
LKLIAALAIVGSSLFLTPGAGAVENCTDRPCADLKVALSQMDARAPFDAWCETVGTYEIGWRVECDATGVIAQPHYTG